MLKKRSLLLFFLLLTLGSQSFARLGERVSTLELGAARARSAKVMIYDVRTSEVNGIAIKEYFSNDGVVFAVSWRGVAQPDLTDILGSYFAEYDKAAKEQLGPQRRGKSATISAGDIVVRKFGHMRDIRGVAVVSSLLPIGVTAEELQ